MRKEISLPHDHGHHQNLSLAGEILQDLDSFRTISEEFRTLGDPNRVRIFWLLCHYEECGANLAALLKMSGPAVSHHLKCLKEAGLIGSRRVGREVYYRTGEDSRSQLLHQMIEQVMEITCPELDQLTSKLDHAHPEDACQNPVHPADACQEHALRTVYQDDQLETIHQIHDLLTVHMDQRWSVETLARMFLMNPTTLKDLFKKEYGNSIAAHIREHRMEKAAELLRTTDQSLGSIAGEVGYSSQSKFTAAFKEYYKVLPKDYRKKHRI